jgi:hypothetical protein
MKASCSTVGLSFISAVHLHSFKVWLPLAAHLLLAVTAVTFEPVLRSNSSHELFVRERLFAIHRCMAALRPFVETKAGGGRRMNGHPKKTTGGEFVKFWILARKKDRPSWILRERSHLPFSLLRTSVHDGIRCMRTPHHNMLRRRSSQKDGFDDAPSFTNHKSFENLFYVSIHSVQPDRCDHVRQSFGSSALFALRLDVL